MRKVAKAEASFLVTKGAVPSTRDSRYQRTRLTRSSVASASLRLWLSVLSLMMRMRAP
jgi:hypothetical protein